MAKVVRFQRPATKCENSARNSSTSKKNSRKLSRHVPTESIANVLAQLALVNPYGLSVLEDLARRMIEATVNAQIV